MKKTQSPCPRTGDPGGVPRVPPQRAQREAGRPVRGDRPAASGALADHPDRPGQPRRRPGAQLIPALPGGKPREQIAGNARGDDPSWDVAADKTIADVIAEFESAWAASRQIAAGFALDQTVPHDQLGRVSLRFVYVNVNSEHARHAGHADILREQIDSATGE
jgi:hypothetical protein